MNLYLVPASRANIELTIARRVPLAEAEQHLTGEQTAELRNALAGEEGFHCWAMTKGHRSTFASMQPGDIVLMALKGSGMFDYAGRIIHKLVSESLGNHLWSYVPGDPWKYIYILDDVSPQAVSKRELVTAIGYQPDYPVYGSSRVNDAYRDAMVDSHGSIEAFLGAHGVNLGDAAERRITGAQERIFGHIPGYPEGSTFASRAELAAAGVHRPTEAGISGAEDEGADSIVLSGDEEDVQDLGDVIIYTGQGGRDQNTGQQISDQTLTQKNLALAKNKTLGLPVRVSRGGRHRSPFTPASGYRYDGLFSVDDYWHETGSAGFRVWRYRLVKIKDEVAPPQTPEPAQGSLIDDGGGRQPARRETTTLRIVRDTKKAREVKRLYDFTCQMCGERLEGPAGPYAEAAHIRPLGAPHNGPDSTENLLCLCPNHHVLFDLGGVTIAEDLTLIGTAGSLTVHPRHRINAEHIRYHREHYLVRE